MEILFIATNLPIPPNNGAAIRSLSIIQALKSSGHKLSFISFANRLRTKDLHPLSSYCNSIDLIDRDLKNLTAEGEYLRRIGSLCTLRSFSIERFRSTTMRERIQFKLKQNNYDLIVSDGIFALANIPKTAVPIALNCHNIEHVIFDRFARLEQNLIKKYYAIIESYLLRMAEHSGCDRAYLAMVCSEVDQSILRELNRNLPTYVVPNVVDTDLIQPIATGAMNDTKPVILFQGGMDWFPNRDAVEYFVYTLLPLVRVEFPNVRFVVAGRNPPVEFIGQFRSDPMIEFTGTIPDMRPWLASATVVIVPLRIGGGTRIKILEACAAGKPVVSTTVGAEGLNLEDGKEIILADDPKDFSCAVVSLLNDPTRCAAISQMSRLAVTARYSLLALKKSLDSAISRLSVGHDCS